MFRIIKLSFQEKKTSPDKRIRKQKYPHHKNAKECPNRSMFWGPPRTDTKISSEIEKCCVCQKDIAEFEPYYQHRSRSYCVKCEVLTR